MRQSLLFPGTKKEVLKSATSVNHRLLVKAGFIDQLMSGSFTLLPLGMRVIQKIHAVIREELNNIGCQEILMPLLHPKSIWNETGRWDQAKAVMYQIKMPGSKEYALSFTHEEIFLDLVRKHIKSYQDLPVALYHFSTKFRNEKRARSGILRGREFMMNDLYSIHTDEKDFWRFYEDVKKAYLKIFDRLGFKVKVTEAGGGVFTKNVTHEFQVLAPSGEDTIFYCSHCDFSQNKEIFKGDYPGKCPRCSQNILMSNAIEVGNIFPLGTFYSEKMHVYFVDKDGLRKPVFFGSYGIGTTRLMGAWVEISHDDKGIIWNYALSPFDLHLVEMPDVDATPLYEKLKSSGFEVLYDDRRLSPAEKLVDADLIGIPVRLVVSKKNKGRVEYKERSEKNFLIFEFGDLLNHLKKVRKNA